MMTKRNRTMKGDRQERHRGGPCGDLYSRGKGKGPDFFPALYFLATADWFQGHPGAPVRLQSPKS